MSDTKSGDDKTLSVATKKTLTLKRPGMEQGTVRQNFSHGRTKAVVVETKKRKFSIPGEKPDAAPAVTVFKPKPQVQVATPPVQEVRKPQPAGERSGMVLNEQRRRSTTRRRLSPLAREAA